MKIRVKYGFSYLKGDTKPYFSITCDIFEYGKDVGGGAAHDAIVKAFPELEYLIKWHLVNDDENMKKDMEKAGIEYINEKEYMK